MAVSSLKEQFERLSVAVSDDIITSSPTHSSSNNKTKSKEQSKHQGSPSLVSKKQLKQIGKTVSAQSPNESRKLKPLPPPATSQKPRSKSVEENNAVIPQVAPKPSCKGSNSSLTKSAEARITKSESVDQSSSSRNESNSTGEPLNCSPNGTPLRRRTGSAKEREAKGLSAPLPLITSTKPQSHHHLPDSTAVNKRPPPLNPKPAVAPKPKMLQKRKTATNDSSSTKTIDSKPFEKNDDSFPKMKPKNFPKKENSPEQKNVIIVTGSSDNENNPFSSSESIELHTNATVMPLNEYKRNTFDSGYQEEYTVGDELNKQKEDDSTDKLLKAQKKRENIANELLATEKTYVDRLKIIAEDFRHAVQSINTKAAKQVIPDSTINIIFLNIGEIYNLNEQLLQDLQERMDNWSSNQQIADVMSAFAPFLKLYSMYTAGFEDAMKKLTETMAKEKKLDAVVKEFEKNLGTGLGIAHYMLEPVQRIPRYKLLLADYLKNLPEDSPERPSATKALEIIGEAADKTNNRIKELENSNEILAIERSLVDYEGTLLLAHRKFIKKGILQKLSRKAQTPRMFFLFSDVLLHTEPTGPSTYKFKNEMSLCAVKLELPKVSLVPHSFELLSTNRSFILSAKSEEDMVQWITALRSAIRDDKEKMRSLKRGEQLLTLDRGFGNSAPILVPDQSVSMCQICSREFTFTFRRHHCRACGRVCCGNCSPFKAYLSYMNKEERICAFCNQQRKQSTGDEIDGELEPIPRARVPSVLILDPKKRETEVIMEGYVHEQDGKRWNRYWYVVKKDFALYKFKAHEDIRAVDTVPLPGYSVKGERAVMTINLIHHQTKKKKLNLTFKAENEEEFDTWIDVIEKATLLEMPSLQENYRLSTSYNRRTRSQSLHDLIESTSEACPTALTPPALNSNRSSRTSDDNST